MTTIAEMARRYKAAISDGVLYEDAILSTDLELIEVNKDNLLRGLNALGAKITPAYKGSAYALKKQRRNALPPFGTPDLLDKGTFYSKIEFHIAGRRLVWENSDRIAGYLLSEYDSVLGVFENNALQKYRQLFLYPAIAREIKRKTGMK